MVAGDREHAADLLFFEEGAQRAVVAADLVGGHPAERDARRDRPLDHRTQELGPRLPSRSGAGRAPGRSRKTPIWQMVTFPAVHVYCRCTRRAGATLFEPGVVPDRHSVRAAERRSHVPAQVIADRVLVPPGRGERRLHPAEIRLVGVLGQRPAGLPLQPDSIPAMQA